MLFMQMGNNYKKTMCEHSDWAHHVWSTDGHIMADALGRILVGGMFTVEFPIGRQHGLLDYWICYDAIVYK